METCERCGRPRPYRGGGMGGQLPGDPETECVSPGGMWCRVAAEGYKRGVRDAIAKAKRLASIDSRLVDDGDGYVDDMSEIDRSDVDGWMREVEGR